MMAQAHSSRLLKALLVLLVLVGHGTAARAQTSEIPAAFLDVGYGARPMGMGGAFVALADDANAVLWNPAGLVLLRRAQLTGMYANQAGLVPCGFVGYVRPHWQRIGLGAGVIYSGDAALQEMTLLLSAARRVTPDLAVGLSVKTRWAGYGHNPEGAWDPGGGNRQVQGHALGFGCDLGVLYAVGQRTMVGLMWRDILAPVSWDAHNEVRTARGGGESVPMALALGAAQRLGDDVAVSLNLDQSLTADTADRIRMGYENRLWDMLFLRLGYGQQINATPDRLYAVGLGVAGDVRESWHLQFDMAYLFHELANTPRVSLTLEF
jgi:long-subunit fatty acid transport protein